jgi:hypothetical protein
VDQRNLWETRAWLELKAASKNQELTPSLMEESFIPLVAQLPMMEPVAR